MAVVKASISTTWNVCCSWTGGHGFETPSGRTWGHDRSQTLKSDEAKWWKLTKITRVGSVFSGGWGGGEIPMILRKLQWPRLRAINYWHTCTPDSLTYSHMVTQIPGSIAKIPKLQPLLFSCPVLYTMCSLTTAVMHNFSTHSLYSPVHMRGLDALTQWLFTFLPPAADAQWCTHARAQQRHARRSLTLKVLVATIDAQWEGWGCRVGEVRAGTTSPMPDHKGFKLQ